MQAEDLVVDKGGQGQVVEKISEILPYICIAILSETFVVKSVNLGNLPGLVISTEDCDPLRITDFKNNEESYGFN